jgi:hypothetical protein
MTRVQCVSHGALVHSTYWRNMGSRDGIRVKTDI